MLPGFCSARDFLLFVYSTACEGRNAKRGKREGEKQGRNLWSAYCLHFAYYNFCRIHKTIRVTPAMEAGITDHAWELAELLA
jgi:hypothetical protein